MEREIQRTLVLKKIQTKEAWDGVGVEGQMERGKGRKGMHRTLRNVSGS